MYVYIIMSVYGYTVKHACQEVRQHPSTFSPVVRVYLQRNDSPLSTVKKSQEKVSQKINMNSFYAKKLKVFLMKEYFFFESFSLLDSTDYLSNSIHPS